MTGILLPLLMILFACVVIWRAVDGFELASEYLGRNLSEGVRGGTINAISSSIPELLTTLIALFVLRDEEGFGIGLGTTAGSALFNGLIIPAACILTVVGGVVAGRRITAVRVSAKVIWRDGLALLACEVAMIALISGTQLDWWQGLALVAIYLVYFAYMVLSMRRRPLGNAGAGEGAGSGERGGREADPGHASSGGFDPPPARPSVSRGPIGHLIYWGSGGPLLDLPRWLVRPRHRQAMREEGWNAWPLLLVATGVMAAACWLLVQACEWLGSGDGNATIGSYRLFGIEFTGLGMPSMFVAVIFASMATSVPDTVISIRDARDGDYDDAVANALGSNLFDIGFALGLPIFAYTLMRGPISVSPEAAALTGELLLILLGVTLAAFLTYYIGPRGRTADGVATIEMGRGTAAILLSLYLTFGIYVIARSQDASWAAAVADVLVGLWETFPRAGAGPPS